MAKVPRARNCTVAHTKITHYLLAFKSKNDKSKAFLGYGFTQQDWKILEAALIQHVNTHDYVGVRPVYDLAGTLIGHNYSVECDLQTPDKRNPCIVTVWTVLIWCPRASFRYRDTLALLPRFVRGLCRLADHHCAAQRNTALLLPSER
ncbi:MAG: DUF6883 domain-containing protein [Acetobacteraceae bacterium]|jgi:filamentous hemagglutinin